MSRLYKKENVNVIRDLILPNVRLIVLIESYVQKWEGKCWKQCAKWFNVKFDICLNRERVGHTIVFGLPCTRNYPMSRASQ